MKGYNQVKKIVELTRSYIGEGKINKKNELSKINQLFKEVDLKKLQEKHARKGFDLMLNAFNKGFVEKALNSSKKVLMQLGPVANDFPFNVGDEVLVIRYEHGWTNCDMKAKIVEKWKDGGIWTYKAQVFSDKKYDEEYIIQINHTRDAVKA